MSNSEFSSDIWGDFIIQECDLTDCDLSGLNPKDVNLTGVKIASWQQSQLLEQLGVIVL
ncbi:Qnr [Vibrio ponticus]|nr:Qnr [Vibrio ponticus]